MKRFFLFGVLFLFLIAIPLTIMMVKTQQTTTGSAAATSTLSISPASITTLPNGSVSVDVVLDPAQNVVSSVKLVFTFDPTYLSNPQINPNTTSFPQILDGPTVSSGSATITLGIGSNTSNAITTSTKVATITFQTLSETTAPTAIGIDTTQSQVLSISTTDQPAENVLASTVPGSVTISTTAPTSAPQATATPGQTATPVPSGTTSAPVCSALSPSKNSGVAPLSVTFTGTASDSAGTITKATFDFGNGQTQEITQNLSGATIQTDYTFTNPGTYPVSLTVTDSNNQISTPCTTSVSVTSSGQTSQASPGATLAATGDITDTFGIVGIVLVLVGAGAFLLRW